MATSSNLPRWDPDASQLALFNEWKGITIQHLVSCKKGIQPFKIPGMLDEVAGKPPLGKMGFGYGHQHILFFLYEMRDDLEFRRVDDKLYIFIRETSVPPEMLHIRKMVLGQKKSRTDTPLKHHGAYARPTELLSAKRPAPALTTSRPQFNRSASSSSYKGNTFRMGNKSSSGRSGPSSPRNAFTAAGARTPSSKSATPTNSNLGRNPLVSTNRPTPTSSFSLAPDFSAPSPSLATTVSRRIPARHRSSMYAFESSSDSDYSEFEFYSGPTSKALSVPTKTESSALPRSPAVKPQLPISSLARPNGTGTVCPSQPIPPPPVHAKRPLDEVVANIARKPAVTPASTLPGRTLNKNSFDLSNIRKILVSSISPQTNGAVASPKPTSSISWTAAPKQSLTKEPPKKKPDMDIHYGYSIDPVGKSAEVLRKFTTATATIPLTADERMFNFNPNKTTIRFPPYLRGDATPSLKHFLEQSGQWDSNLLGMFLG